MKAGPRSAGISFWRGKIQLAEIEHGKKTALTVLAEGPTTLDFSQAGVNLSPNHPQVATLSGEITELLRNHKIRAEALSFALPPDTIFMNIVPLPETLKGPKLTEHLRWEMSQYSTDWNPDEHVLTSHALPLREPGIRYSMMVCVKKGMVGFLQKVAGELGFRIGALDIDVFCSEKSLKFNYPEIIGHTVVLFGVRWGAVDANLVRDGELIDYRRFTAQIPGDVLNVVGSYLKYLKEREAFAEPSALFFSGLDLAPGLFQKVKSETGIQAMALNAVRKLPAAGRIYEQFLKESSRFAAAIGLALRSPS
jgi:Tfp pilus assembly PilM family ATPase